MMPDNIKPRVVLENLRSSSSLPTRLHSCQSTPCSSKRNSSRKTSKGLNSTAITKAPKCGGLKSFRLGGKRCKAVGRFHQMHVCTCLWPHKPMCFSHSLGTSMQQSIQGLKQDPRLKSGACNAHFFATHLCWFPTRHPHTSRQRSHYCLDPIQFCLDVRPCRETSC